MLYARALLMRNCGRFTHVSSDFGSQYHTHTFVTSEALYASLTRGVTWRHEGKFVDLEEDAGKSASGDYFFCDYDVKAKPLWFTPGVFVDKQFRLLPKQRGVVDKSDFNVVDEGRPSTGGGGRAYYCPTYGLIESVLPNHRLLTCALSPKCSELEWFTAGQTFIMGKKRTMFQLMDASAITELVKVQEDVPIHECQPVQVKVEQVIHFREYEVLAGTARYLLVRGRTSDASLAASFTFSGDLTLIATLHEIEHDASLAASFTYSGEAPTIRRVLPAFWVEQVQQRFSN